jgi:hypothetical protein
MPGGRAGCNPCEHRDPSRYAVGEVAACRRRSSYVLYWAIQWISRFHRYIKVKLSLCLTKHHAMKSYWGSGGIAPRILDLGTRWRRVVSFTPWPLYPQGNSHWDPLDRRLGGPQSRSGHGGEEKNSQPRRELNPRNPFVQPIAQRYTNWTITALLVMYLLCWICQALF